MYMFESHKMNGTALTSQQQQVGECDHYCMV